MKTTRDVKMNGYVDGSVKGLNERTNRNVNEMVLKKEESGSVQELSIFCSIVNIYIWI